MHRIKSGDSSAFYRYINQRRACKHGIAPLLDVNSELAVTDHDKADIITSIFTVDDGILPQVDRRKTYTKPTFGHTSLS